jgi:hypothetical protein
MSPDRRRTTGVRLTDTPVGHTHTRRGTVR